MITTLTGKNEFACTQKLGDIINAWRSKNPDSPIEAYEAEDIESANSFINDLQTINLFSARRLVIVRHISDNKDLLSLIEKYGDKIPSEVSVVLYDPGLDLRTKVAKWLKAHSDWHEARPLDRFKLQAWLRDQIKLSKLDITSGAQTMLLERTSGDQLRLSQELDKLMLQNGTIDESVVELLVPRSLDDNIFDLLDAICRQQKQRATQLLADFQMGKTDPHYIYNMLVWQFNVVTLSLASDKSPEAIAEAADMKPGAIARAKSLRATISPKRLGELLGLMAEIDEEIRQGDAWQQLDRLLF